MACIGWSTRLVYYEMHQTMDAAILREKRLTKWNRAWAPRTSREKASGGRKWRGDLGPDEGLG